MKWTYVCPFCGYKETTPMNYTVKEAQTWALLKDRQHQEVCSERKKGSEEEA